MNYRQEIKDYSDWVRLRASNYWGDIEEDGTCLWLHGYGIRLSMVRQLVKGGHAWTACALDAGDDIEDGCFGFDSSELPYERVGARAELLVLRSAVRDSLHKLWCRRFDVRLVDFKAQPEDLEHFRLAGRIANELTANALLLFAAHLIDELRATSARLMG